MKVLAAIAAAFAIAQQAPLFKSSIDVVTVPVSVLSGNRPVTDLTAADFELLDNGVPQRPQAAPLDALPIDVTLLVDASDSLRGQALDAVKRDVRAIGERLPAGDRVRMLTFADNVSDPGGFQPGGAALPVDAIVAGGATSLYSGLAAALVTAPRVARPQLVFAMTDGRDSASFLSAGQVLALAGRTSACLYLAIVVPSAPLVQSGDKGQTPGREENTLVHPVQRGIYDGISAVTRAMGPYTGGPNLSILNGIAARTGGAVFNGAAYDSLPTLFGRALEDFRRSYLLSYTPSGVSDTGWHEITVKVSNRRYTIRARKGYQH